MPGSIPLQDIPIKNELIRYLPTGWEPVLDRDVDGPKATPASIDNQETRFGRIHAARRVSRTIFLGSARPYPAKESGASMRNISVWDAPNPVNLPAPMMMPSEG